MSSWDRLFESWAGFRPDNDLYAQKKIKKRKKKGKNLMSNNNDPLISINWSKIKRYLGALLKTGVGLVRGVVEGIAKGILKILTLFVRGLFEIYKGFSKFAKSKQKGVWILLLIFFLFFLAFRVYAQGSEKQDLQKKLEIRNEEFQNSLDKYDELIDTIGDLDDKIQVYNTQKQKLAKAQAQLAYSIPEPELKAKITKYAIANNVNIPMSECVVMRESGGRPNAVGDNGKAVGLAQYWLATWQRHRRQMGRSTEDLRRDPDEALDTMTWAISQGMGREWTAYRKFCT